jgi:glycosyltransferase involved in cell wall biosynthesis
MRICVITRSYNQLLGGMEYITQSLCRGLCDKGHDVSVITSSHPENKDVVGMSPTIYHASSGKPGRYSKAYFTFVEDMFNKLHGENPFNVLHVESTAILFRPPIPYVIRMHGTNYTEFMTALRNPTLKSPYTLVKQVNAYRTYKPFVRDASAVIAISESLSKQINSEYHPKEIRVIYNGIDTDKFSPMEAPSKKIILYCGRLIQAKGYKTLIDIMPCVRKHVCGAELHIAGGDGEDTEEVKYLGKISRDDLPEVYASCDLLAFPTSRIEGLPLAPLEAMACGKPVVTTPYGGREIVTPYVDGYIICDIGGLVDGIIKLLTSNEARLHMGENARKKVLQKFSISKMVEDHERLYHDVTR